MKNRYIILLFLFFIFSAQSGAQQVVLGTGTALSVFSPICASRDYSATEIIYLASDINISGNITAFAFERFDGSYVGQIQNVYLYMQHTNNTVLSTGTFSTAGYQLVYYGSWPNDSGAGWREVILSSPFAYDGVSNLQVLVHKDYDPAVDNTPVAPRWVYTNTAGTTRARRYFGNDSLVSTTSLTSSAFCPNGRLNFGTVSVREIGKNSFSVFPNPASNQLSLSLSPELEGQHFTIEIMNINSELVKKEQLHASMQVDVQHLPAGIYFYRLLAPEKILSGKFLIQK